MRQWFDFDEEPGRIWVDLESAPERMVDADPAPSPTYAKPTPTDATPPSHATQLGRKVARVGLAILLLLVGVGAWVLLALPAGVLGCVLGLAVTGALIAGTLYALRSSVFWRW
jgi:hypothetical protein